MKVLVGSDSGDRTPEDGQATTRPVTCPRCHLPASGTARRRGRCTACGASLASADARAADVREILHGRRAPAHRPAPENRERSASR